MKNRICFFVACDGDNEPALEALLRAGGFKFATAMSRAQIKRIYHTFLEKEFNDAADDILREGPERRKAAPGAASTEEFGPQNKPCAGC